MEVELPELRGLCFELLEISLRVRQNWGIRMLHHEIDVFERVILAWGGWNVRWDLADD